MDLEEIQTQPPGNQLQVADFIRMFHVKHE